MSNNGIPFAPKQVDTSEYHKDEGKPRTDLLPPRALLAMAAVFEYGQHKYGDRNWERYADDWKWGQLMGSTLRHLFAWMKREDIDGESPHSHLAHAMADLAMLYELQATGHGEDDRTRL